MPLSLCEPTNGLMDLFKNVAYVAHRLPFLQPVASSYSGGITIVIAVGSMLILIGGAANKIWIWAVDLSLLPESFIAAVCCNGSSVAFNCYPFYQKQGRGVGSPAVSGEDDGEADRGFSLAVELDRRCAHRCRHAGRLGFTVGCSTSPESLSVDGEDSAANALTVEGWSDLDPLVVVVLLVGFDRRIVPSLEQLSPAAMGAGLGKTMEHQISVL
ncbi:hypothetical protein ACLOJK_026796 [Asimina triloba]